MRSIEEVFADLGFPRVSGDEPVTTKVRTAPIKFSPRERG